MKPNNQQLQLTKVQTINKEAENPAIYCKKGNKISCIAVILNSLT